MDETSFQDKMNQILERIRELPATQTIEAPTEAVSETADVRRKHRCAELGGSCSDPIGERE